MADADMITVDELRVRRLKERLSSIVTEYESKLIEAGIERDIMRQQFEEDRKNLIRQHSEELARMSQRIQELEADEMLPVVVPGEVQ